MMGKKIEKLIGLLLGIIMLIPPIIGVWHFILAHPFSPPMYIPGRPYMQVWTAMGIQGTSALPIYLGLMAIAGAILIRGSISFNKD